MSDLSADLAMDLGGGEPGHAPVVIDHVAAGIARLPWRWRDKPHMIAMLTIFLKRYNDLEQAYQDLLLLRSLQTANADIPDSTTGAQLDRLGALVGQRRNGLINADYRRYISARIAANNSNGRIEDLIRVASLILNDTAAIVVVSTEAIATAVIEIAGVPIDDSLANILVEFLRVAVADGPSFLQITHPTDPGHTFTMGDALSPGSDVDTGFGDATEVGQPALAPYHTAGVTGGQLSDGRF